MRCPHIDYKGYLIDDLRSLLFVIGYLTVACIKYLDVVSSQFVVDDLRVDLFIDVVS